MERVLCQSKQLGIFTVPLSTLHGLVKLLDLSIDDLHKVKGVKIVLYSLATMFNKLHYVVNKRLNEETRLKC